MYIIEDFYLAKQSYIPVYTTGVCAHLNTYYTPMSHHHTYCATSSYILRTP